MPTRAEFIFGCGVELVFAAVGYLIGGTQAAVIALFAGVLLMALAVRFRYRIDGSDDNDESPVLIDRIVTDHQDRAFLEIKNTGASAEVTARITASSGFKNWPTKTLWCRWDHDMTAKTAKIAHGTSERLRLADKKATATTLTWGAYWLSDWGAQGSPSDYVSVFGDPATAQWESTLTIRIVAEPELPDGPIVRTVRLRGDGDVVRS